MSNPKPIVKMVSCDELKGEAKQLFCKMEEATGKVPKWMKVMANNEDILVGFFAMFKATMDDSPIEKELKWKIAFMISEINKCKFCVSVAEQQLKTFGMDVTDVSKITTPADEREKVAFEFAKSVNDHAYKIDPELIEKIKKEFSDAELVELTCVVGLFNYINRFNDALNIFPDLS